MHSIYSIYLPNIINTNKNIAPSRTIYTYILLLYIMYLYTRAACERHSYRYVGNNNNLSRESNACISYCFLNAQWKKKKVIIINKKNFDPYEFHHITVLYFVCFSDDLRTQFRTVMCAHNNNHCSNGLPIHKANNIYYYYGI